MTDIHSADTVRVLRPVALDELPTGRFSRPTATPVAERTRRWPKALAFATAASASGGLTWWLLEVAHG